MSKLIWLPILIPLVSTAKSSTATLTLQGVVPRIVHKYVMGNKVIVDYNFPINVPTYCIQVSQTRLECIEDLIIQTTE